MKWIFFSLVLLIFIIHETEKVLFEFKTAYIGTLNCLSFSITAGFLRSINIRVQGFFIDILSRNSG